MSSLTRTLKYGGIGLGVLGAVTGVHMYKRRKRLQRSVPYQLLTHDIHKTRALIDQGHVKRSTVEQTLRRLMEAREQVKKQKPGSTMAAYEASRDHKKKVYTLLGWKKM